MTRPAAIEHISAVIPVFNDSERALRAVARLTDQRLPPGATLEIIVVDDGSVDTETTHLRRALPANVKLIERERNGGRSAACQTGIDAATGDAVLILDCDCEPVGDRFLMNHCAAFTSNTVATIGPIVGFDGSFWDRYQREASARRRRLFDDGASYAGTTANVVIRAAAARAAGGFELAYRNYGFEDRDLLIKLSRLGDIQWRDDAVVRHLDRITMKSVLEKMWIAGRESAQLFAMQHPEEYRELGYAAIDASQRPWLRGVARLSGALAMSFATAFDALEQRQLLPWRLGFVAARLLGATSFMAGTASRPRN